MTSKAMIKFRSKFQIQILQRFCWREEKVDPSFLYKNCGTNYGLSSKNNCLSSMVMKFSKILSQHRKII